jgi:hypothetical protein
MASIARANETLVCRGKKWFRGTDIYRQSELDHRGDKQSITIKSQDAQAEISGRHDQFAAIASALRNLTQKKTGNLLRRAAASPLCCFNEFAFGE